MAAMGAPQRTTPTTTLLAVAVAALVLQLQLMGCTSRIEDSPAYKAACHGPPLRGDTARRNHAQEEGYAINPRFDCVDRASFVFISEQKARWDAANTPEARALRQAEQHRLMSEQQASSGAARANAEEVQPTPPVPTVVQVDVNTATEAELAGIPPLDPTVAAQIVEQRGVRRFGSWDDLVARIVGLSAAQTAMYASTSGLTVNGESLPGAPPDAETAAQLRAKHPRAP